MKTAKEIQDIIQQGESLNLELKSKFEPDKIGQTLCALSNDWDRMGIGILLIGVTDREKSIIGFQESEDDLQQNIANVCRNAITPAIAPKVYVVDLEKPIMVIEVTPSHNSPSRHKNVCYIRVGATTRKATFSEEAELANRMKSVSHEQNATTESPVALASDAPPKNHKWVGRTTEIQQLSNPNFKVVFITGIGGQGKSGLASHYVKNVLVPGNEFEYWDWRDLKEEEHRLNSKIISIIERLTYGKISPHMLQNQVNSDLLETLFHYIGNRKIVFIFDNIDRYIDRRTFLPTDGIDKLVQLALNKEHNCKFLFTCRPNIQYIGVGFYDLRLNGLALQDTLNLFEDYQIPMKKEEVVDLATEAYRLTSGHPFWLNLVAAQALRGKATAFKFIDGIKFNRPQVLKDDSFSVLSEDVLKTVWDNLSQNQRVLLRGMSEAVRAESEDNLAKMLSDVLHYHKFSKALRILKSLNLIVIKSSFDEPDLLELHPLVKSFIISKYNLNERAKYITVLVKHFVACILNSKLKEASYLNDFDNWIDKIELNINEEDYKSALKSLNEISPHILRVGYAEEYVRLAHMLFVKVNWRDAINGEYPFFNTQFNTYTKKMIEFGKFVEVSQQLTKYEQLCKGNDHSKCIDLRCYLNWYNKDFDSAIKWGQRYWDLLRVSDSHCAPPHNLLLSWRDSKHPDNIEKALNGFLGSEKLDDILYEKLPNAVLSSSFYGNIGRCFWYNNKPVEAMICYSKSLLLLNIENTEITIPNKGYAFQWIAEILIGQGDNRTACFFYQNAILKWNRVLPHRTKLIESNLFDIINNHPDLECITKMEEREIEETCNDYLSNLTIGGHS